MAPLENLSSEPSGASSVQIESVLVKQAYDHIDAEAYQSATDLFQDVLRRFGSALPDSQKSLIHSELATLSLWLGDYEAAEHHAEKSLLFDDRNDQAYSVLGKVQLARFRFPEARACFSKISEENPLRFLGMAWVALKLRETVAAEMHLKEARKLIPSPLQDPEFAVAHAYLFLLKGDTKTAIQEARAFLKKTPRDVFLVLQLAEIFMTAGNYGEAEGLVGKVSKKCPNNDAAYAIFAHSAYAQEDFRKAEENARKAVKLNPGNAYAKTVLMKIAMRDGHYAQAEEVGAEILKQSPEYSLGHANLGDVYFNQGRYELAEVEYEQTQNLMHADTKGARLRKARMAFIKQNFKEAADILEDLVEHYHTYYDDAMCDLLLCYGELGDTEKQDDIKQKMVYRKSFYHRAEQLLKSLSA